MQIPGFCPAIEQSDDQGIDDGQAHGGQGWEDIEFRLERDLDGHLGMGWEEIQEANGKLPVLQKQRRRYVRLRIARISLSTAEGRLGLSVVY